MNKKFTMMVATLLAAGSFSVNAESFELQQAPVKLDNGKFYLVANFDGNVNAFTENQDLSLGASISRDGKTLASLASIYQNGAFDSDANEVGNFLWEVVKKTDAGKDYFTFKNTATGKYLAFKDGAFVTVAENAVESKSNIYFSLEDVKEGTKVKGQVLKLRDENKYLNITAAVPFTAAPNNFTLVETSAEATLISAHKVTIKDVKAHELNAVLGGDGFSLSPVDKATDDENNIFSKQIKAIDFAEMFNDVTDEYIPAGMYFVLNGPASVMNKESVSESTFGSKDAYIKAFRACTFVAVSSWDNYQTSAVNNAGLKLIEISGNDLVTYIQEDADGVATKYATSKKEIYAGNATFTVKEPDQYQKAGQYQIAVANARVKEANKDSHKEAPNLLIGVSKIAGTNYVTTTTEETLFKTTTSSLVKATSLLNNEKKAAVYTIKFVSNTVSESSEEGKLLGVAVVNGYSADLVAQGSALVDASLPQYQFVVSSVNEENNQVTFTNIETGSEFTTQLYKTDTEDQYKLVGTTEEVRIAVESEEGYWNYTTGMNMNSMVVELKKVDVDAYAGFFKKDIENNETYRLAFATNATTNNKLYVAVSADDKTKTELSDNASLQVVFEPVANANNKIVEKNISSTFVYNNNDKVYKATTDLVTYYTYKVRVVDTENSYLKANYSGYNTSVKIENGKDNGSTFIAKKRYDGAISLVADLSIDVNDYALAANAETANYKLVNAYQVPSKNTMNLYLEEEKVGVSLAAKSGHFTFEAENGGYMGVNDKNEGIVAISTEASEDLTFWLDTTDSEKLIPSFYISKGGKFMYNATDSLYAYGNKPGNPYEVSVDQDKTAAKAIFKKGELVGTDTIKVTVDNKEATVAAQADQNKGILGGLNNFKYQIVKPNEVEENYVIRLANTNTYVSNINGVLAFISDKASAMRVNVEGAAAPTSNESVSTSEIKVIAQNGSIVVKNAAGKNVVVSTILGQIVANEVLTSDNATVNVPAGIVVVSVDGESFKVNVK